MTLPSERDVWVILELQAALSDVLGVMPLLRLLSLAPWNDLTMPDHSLSWAIGILKSAAS